MKEINISQYDFNKILKGESAEYLDKNGDVVLSQLAIQTELTIENGTFNKNIYFDNVTFNNLLKIIGGNFRNLRFRDSNSISIFSGVFDNLHIDDLVSYKNIGISYSISGTKDLLIKKLHISAKRRTNIINANINDCYLILQNSAVEITASTINNFQIKGEYTLDRVLEMSFNKIENLSFIDCRAKNLNFANLKSFKSGTISFIRTNFYENMRFYNCNFLDYSIGSFNDSDISKILLPSTFFPTSFDKKVTNSERELYFRTMKIVYELSANYSKFSEYRALEYEMLFKNMKRTWKNIPFLILLFLNKITNIHGTKWQRAFFEIFIIGFLFFYFYIKSMNLIVTEHLYHFFYFLLPIHPIDYVCSCCITDKTILIDTIHRIINSFLIYQLIVAFRRFGR